MSSVHLLASLLLGTLAHSQSISDADLLAFANSIQGYVVLPSDRNFTKVSRQWNARFDSIKPRALIYCTAEEDVVSATRLVNKYSLCYTARSAGHSFPGWAVQNGCIIIDVSLLSKTVYDPSTQFVTVGPGTTFWDFTHELGKVKRTTTHGFGPTVAFGGYTQGGGVGLTHRKYGLAIDNLLSARVVLTDGNVVTANSTAHSDLFWALRGGGGGNWGTVTSFTFKTYCAASPVLYVMMEWKFSRTLVNETGTIWQNYFVNNTDVDMGFYWRINGNPVLGELGTTIQIYGIYTGEVEAGRNVTRSLVKLFPTPPHSVDVLETTVDAAYIKFMQPFRHVPHTGFFLQSRLLSRPLDSEALPILAKELDKLHALQTFTLIWMDPLGGKVAEVGRTDTAFPWRDAFANFAIFVFYLESFVEKSASSWMDNTWSKLSPSLGENKVYINFCYENATDPQTAYFGLNYPRLQSIKNRYDPSERMKFPQSVKLPATLQTLISV